MDAITTLMGHGIVRLLIACIMLGLGAWWAIHDFRKGYENFYFNMSIKIKRIVRDIKEEMKDRDTEKLVDIFFYSFEEHMLYILKHHKFTQKRRLTDKDFARYNNMFYVQMSGIYMEWVINSVDDKLLSIFLEHQKKAIRIHMKNMKEILSVDQQQVRVRREHMADEFIRFLGAIRDNYVHAYKQYKDVLNGDIKYNELMGIIRIKEEDIEKIFKSLIEQVDLDEDRAQN